MDTTIEAPETTRDGKGKVFRFLTGTCRAFTVKNAETGDDDMFIEGIASSNVRDRYGDTMTAQCQASMLLQSQKLTMFGNHSYDVPEDVYGVCDQSKLETNGDVIDLAIVMRVAKSNDRAVKAWQLISADKVRLAFSIGGIILDAQIDEENDDGSFWFPPLIINDLELLEISLVGIPANPRAYTRSFLEDIKKTAFKVASRDPGVQKAFLRVLGVKSVEEEFTDLGDAGASTADLTPVEPEAGSKACAWKDGCEKSNAAGSLLCAEHIKAAPIEGVEAPADGIVKEGIEVPADDGVTREATLGDEAAPQNTEQQLSLRVDVSAEVTDEAKRLLDEIETRAAALKDECAALDAQITEKKSELATLDADVTRLRDEADKLKATPTGRQTQAHAGGRSTAAKAPRDMTDAELRDYARNMHRGNLEVDARLQVAS